MRLPRPPSVLYLIISVYLAEISSISPYAISFPFSSIIALLHKRCTCSREWDTNSTVTPLSNILKTFFSLFFRNLASPTEMTSSRIRISGDTSVAMENPKPCLHTGRIILNRDIDKFLQFRKLNDLIKFRFQKLLGISEHRTIQKNILTSCIHAESKPAPSSRRGTRRPFRIHLAFGRLEYTGNYFEQSTFSRSIKSQDSYTVTFFHLKINILKSPEFIIFNFFFLRINHVILQAVYLFFTEIKLHTYVIYNYCRFFHIFLLLNIKDKLILFLLETEHSDGNRHKAEYQCVCRIMQVHRLPEHS